MPLERSAAHKITVSALELAKTLISKEVLKSFQRGVGFLIRWQKQKASTCSTCWTFHLPPPGAISASVTEHMCRVYSGHPKFGS